MNDRATADCNPRLSGYDEIQGGAIPATHLFAPTDESGNDGGGAREQRVQWCAPRELDRVVHADVGVVGYHTVDTLLSAELSPDEFLEVGLVTAVYPS